ncbi:hypothetical protein PIB30_064423 [Stylosanthes scabra]|uniref:Retrotransposon gag domain-containing protein n=1 Tax=Stylosanthes scabra TaxID=79078 RepID=A0ABU6ZKG6_9FABA|nr:hypothetical protein [Stylosanthes scabra]
MEKALRAQQVPEGQRVEFAAYLLQGDAQHWWKGIQRLLGRDSNAITWDEFRISLSWWRSASVWMNAVSVWLLRGMLEATCHRGTLVAVLLHKVATLRAAISHSVTFPKEAEVRTVPTLVGTEDIVREMLPDSHWDRVEGNVRVAKDTMAASRVGLGATIATTVESLDTLLETAV